MKKIITITSAALLAVGMAGAVYAQNGANQNAPQPSSTGAGVVTPGTTSTGQAVDKPMMSSTTGSAMKTDSDRKNSDMKPGTNK